MNLPHDEITNDKFTARWNYRMTKFPHDEITHDEIVTMKLP